MRLDRAIAFFKPDPTSYGHVLSIDSSFVSQGISGMIDTARDFWILIGVINVHSDLYTICLFF